MISLTTYERIGGGRGDRVATEVGALSSVHGSAQVDITGVSRFGSQSPPLLRHGGIIPENSKTGSIVVWYCGVYLRAVPPTKTDSEVRPPRIPDCDAGNNCSNMHAAAQRLDVAPLE